MLVVGWPIAPTPAFGIVLEKMFVKSIKYGKTLKRGCPFSAKLREGDTTPALGAQMMAPEMVKKQFQYFVFMACHPLVIDQLCFPKLSQPRLKTGIFEGCLSVLAVGEIGYGIDIDIEGIDLYSWLPLNQVIILSNNAGLMLLGGGKAYPLLSSL